MWFFDPYYFIFMLPAILLMLLAQWYVSSTYRRWSRVPLRQGLSGAEVVEHLMRITGLRVRVEMVQGRLTDHYDPLSRTLRLSPGVYHGRSVAAAAVAAHEFGHALQHQSGYLPLHLRTLMVPAVNFGSQLGWWFIILGLILRVTSVAWLGVLLFSLGAVFAFITLPVEFNASSRAMQVLQRSGIVVAQDEARGVRQVLTAAALTYVAALITAVLQVLYFAFLVRRRD